MNPRTLERYTIPGPSGQLEVALNAAARAARGHRADRASESRSKAARSTTRSCTRSRRRSSRSRYVAVRFNYRGVGASEGTFDNGNGETDDALAVLAHARERLGDAAGRARGLLVRRVHRVARREDRHGRTDRARRHRPSVASPSTPCPPTRSSSMASRTTSCRSRDVFDWARPQELPITVFPGCGHFFHGRLPQLSRVIAGMWHRHPVTPGA